MKLLCIFPSPYRGGAEEYALTVAAGAVRRGWDVHAAFPSNQMTASLIRDFQKKGVRYSPLEILLTQDYRCCLFRMHIPHFFKTLKVLAKIKPDVVHFTLPWPYSAFGSILACAVLGIPAAVVFQLFPPEKIIFKKPRLKAYHWAMSRKQRWIAISENNRRLISESFCLPSGKIDVIYNGSKTDSELIRSSPQEILKLRNQVREELNVSPSSKVLLTVARLEKTKGCLDWIEIAPRLVREFPEIKLVWAGEGSQRPVLENKIKEYRLENTVFLLGNRPDIPQLLKAADLFIFPTYMEGGQSFALTEAMAHGLPVVSSDASGIPEAVTHQKHGILFESKNREQFFAAVRWAVLHPGEMKAMAEYAKQRAWDFSEDQMIEKTFAVLNEAVHRESIRFKANLHPPLSGISQ